jgi:hypothetical protein
MQVDHHRPWCGRGGGCGFFCPSFISILNPSAPKQIAANKNIQARFSSRLGSMMLMFDGY